MVGLLRMLAVAAALVGLLAGPVAAQDDGGDAPLPGEVGGVELSRAQAAVAVALVRHVLKTVDGDASLQRVPTHAALVHMLGRRLADAWPLKEPAPEVFNERRRMQVFVTLYGPGGAELSAEGRGTSLMAAVVDAGCNVPRSPRFRTEGFNRPDNVLMSFDLTVFQVPYLVNIAEPFLYSMRPGIDGLIYQNGDQRGIVLPWESVRRSWDLHFRRTEEDDVAEIRPARTPDAVKKAVFRSLLERAGAHPATWRTPGARVMRFGVQSFVEDRPGGEPLALYRTGPLVRPESLLADDVTAAVRLAADYLARTPDDGDVVRDAFDPLRCEWDAAPAAARQAVVAGALARLYRSEKKPWMLRTAVKLSQKAIVVLERKAFKDRAGRTRDCAYVVVEKRSELATVAQMLIALCEVQQIEPGDELRKTAEQLTNTLLVAQEEDGSFGAYFAPATRDLFVKKDQEDLAGASLSLLAMVRAHELLGGDELLKAARNAAEHLVFRREKQLGRLVPSGLADPCLIEALEAIDRHLVNDGLVTYAASCAEAIARSQVDDATRYQWDELGGFLSSQECPDTEYASFCLRGLKALERLAARIEASAPDRYRKLGLAVAREQASQSARRAEAFLLGLQYTPANSFYTGRPAVAAGGLRHSACDARISTIAVANFILAETK